FLAETLNVETQVPLSLPCSKSFTIILQTPLQYPHILLRIFLQYLIPQSNTQVSFSEFKYVQTPSIIPQLIHKGAFVQPGAHYKQFEGFIEHYLQLYEHFLHNLSIQSQKKFSFLLQSPIDMQYPFKLVKFSAQCKHISLPWPFPMPKMQFSNKSSLKQIKTILKGLTWTPFYKESLLIQIILFNKSPKSLNSLLPIQIQKELFPPKIKKLSQKKYTKPTSFPNEEYKLTAKVLFPYFLTEIIIL
ncbi:hypothetical protein IMG5_047170, partial [Ichthyophthirius multifiliis]